MDRRVASLPIHSCATPLCTGNYCFLTKAPATTFVGAKSYVAPEMLKSSTYDSQAHGLPLPESNPRQPCPP